MNESKHSKHAKLVRPYSGSFGKTEFALVGAPCSVIQMSAKRLIGALSPNYNVTYIDSDHASFDSDETTEFVAEGASMYVSDKQSTWEVNQPVDASKFDRHQLFAQQDLILVNGNHHQAEKQVVYLDSSKTKSLLKRISQLTNVVAFISVDLNEPVEEVREALPNWKEIPVFSVNETESLLTLLKAEVLKNQPELKALVLAGGKSSRMGRDKAKLRYHKHDQVEVVINLAKTLCNEVYLSCRPDQKFDYDIPTIEDEFLGLGPMGAILTAMKNDPTAAWLVLACDLPFLDGNVLNELNANRSVKHIATAFLNPESGFAEPLVTIWEPKSYSRLLQFLSQGYSCPRKVLINSHTHLITPSNSEKLKNVNTPEEYASALKKIQHSE